MRAISLFLILVAPCFADNAVKFQMLRSIPFYVDWPEVKPGKPLRICIIADKNPFKDQMKALPQQKLNGRPLQIFHVEKWLPLPEADIYYFDLEAEAIATRLARALNGKPVIRVSSIPNFSNRGGDIHFHVGPKNTLLEVNREAMLKQGLVPRSKLLKLSKPEVKK